MMTTAIDVAFLCLREARVVANLGQYLSGHSPFHSRNRIAAKA